MGRIRIGFALLVVTVVNSSAVCQTLEKSFEWRYNNQPFELTMTVEKQVYDYFASLPRVIEDYSYYAAQSESIPFVPNLVKGLVRLASEADLNRWQLVELSIAFVQHLPYSEDNGYDHPRFPAETLVDGTGDCEDTAILLAAILEEMGIEATLLSPPKHMGVGIACNGCSGQFYKSNGSKFYYIETTANGWDVGKVPEDLVNKNVKVIHVDRNITIEQRLALNPLIIDPALTRKGEAGSYRDHSVEIKDGSAKFSVQDTKFHENGVIEVYRKRYVRSVDR